MHAIYEELAEEEGRRAYETARQDYFNRNALQLGIGGIQNSNGVHLSRRSPVAFHHSRRSKVAHSPARNAIRACESRK